MQGEATTKKSVATTEELERCYHTVYNLRNKIEQNMYTNQTQRFPVETYQRMQYVMVLYKVNSNTILVEPLRNKISLEMMAAY